jgi:hypothetical protein
MKIKKYIFTFILMTISSISLGLNGTIIHVSNDNRTLAIDHDLYNKCYLHTDYLHKWLPGDKVSIISNIDQSVFHINNQDSAAYASCLMVEKNIPLDCKYTYIKKIIDYSGIVLTDDSAWWTNNSSLLVDWKPLDDILICTKSKKMIHLQDMSKIDVSNLKNLNFFYLP